MPHPIISLSLVYYLHNLLQEPIWKGDWAKPAVSHVDALGPLGTTVEMNVATWTWPGSEAYIISLGEDRTKSSLKIR